MEFIFKKAECQLQRESASVLGFLLEPVNVALGVTREFVSLGVAEFGSSDVIIGIVELLANFIRGTGKTRSSLYGKNES